MSDLVPAEGIESRILMLRGHKVLLDQDLAKLYAVSTSRFNEQVKRNSKRFPADFMFQLTEDETQILRSQIAISRLDWGGRRYRPLAFTEHGVAMLASVLRSQRAIEHLMASGEAKKGRKLGFGRE